MEIDGEKLQRALQYATEKHNGQKRISGLPYITHPVAVAELIEKKNLGTDYRITALFHDLLEDTDATEREIEEIGGVNVLEAVKLLTKRKGYIMSEYVAGIKKNPIAYAVKSADRLHNLRCAFCTDDDFKRKLIHETVDWYLDYSDEIPAAVKALAESLKEPFSIKAALTEKASEAIFAIKGDICYSASTKEIKTVKNGYVLCKDGKSLGVYETLPSEYENTEIRDYDGKLIIPGLSDLHIHAPQYAYRGTGMDLELMEWLQKRAFPEEIKYSDLNYANKAYTIFADNIKKSATTRICVFATRHRAATELLMSLMDKTGVMSFVGKVNMDREAPAAICEPDCDYSVLDTLGWLQSVSGKYRRTKPIITPRFVPSCTEELLGQLGEICSDYELPIQSHLSENTAEIEWVMENCKNASFYGDVYDKYGLFGKNYKSGKALKTIMAHCVHSTKEELDLIKKNNVYVAHCPASNTNLASGIAPIRKYLDMGIPVGLGSDVAGGQTESVFRAITDAIQMSKLYRRLVDTDFMPLTFAEAFYMATKGGGKFFGKVGSFEADYEFDAVVLDDLCLPHPQELSIIERLERAAYLSLDIYGIKAKYVAGELIFENE